MQEIKKMLFQYPVEPPTSQIGGWLFAPGMAFGTREGWWGAGKQRVTPHEGVDFYTYLTAAGQPVTLGPGAAILAVTAGFLYHSHPDFLGQTLYLHHPQYEQAGAHLFSIYGHVCVAAGGGIEQGSAEVQAGEVIGTLNKGRSGKVPPHLHLSMAWVCGELPIERLSWSYLNASAAVRFVDPLCYLADPTLRD